LNYTCVYHGEIIREHAETAPATGKMCCPVCRANGKVTYLSKQWGE